MRHNKVLKDLGQLDGTHRHVQLALSGPLRSVHRPATGAVYAVMGVGQTQLRERGALTAHDTSITMPFSQDSNKSVLVA